MRLIYSKVTSQPATEPVTTDELKAHLNIASGFTSDDSLIAACGVAARAWLEEHCGQSFITQTRTQYMDSFPNKGYIDLLFGPVVSVTSLSYRDENDQAQTVDLSEDVWVDINRVIPRITVINSWPSVGDRPGSVQCVYVCGYGAASAVPEPIKGAIKMLTTHLYQNRVPEIQNGTIGRLEFAIDKLVGPYRVIQNAAYA